MRTDPVMGRSWDLPVLLLLLGLLLQCSHPIITLKVPPSRGATNTGEGKAVALALIENLRYRACNERGG